MPHLKGCVDGLSFENTANQTQQIAECSGRDLRGDSSRQRDGQVKWLHWSFRL